MSRPVASLFIALVFAGTALSGCLGGDDGQEPTPTTPTGGSPTPTSPTGGGQTDLAANIHARHCVAYAIDRAEIVDAVLGGQAEPALSMVPNGMEGQKPSWKKWAGGADGTTADLENAKKHCGFAGFNDANKLRLDLWYTPTHYGDTEADLALVLEQQLEATGAIDVTLKSTEWQQYKTDFRNGNYNIFLLGWFPDYLDPDNYLSSFYTEGGAVAAGSFYKNQQMESLLAKQAAMPTGAERNQVLGQVQDLAAEHLPYIPIYQGKLQAVAKNDVSGVPLAPHQVFTYWTLDKGDADTITVGTTDSITSLDNADAYEYMSNNILYNTGCPLTWYEGETTNIVPHCAESYESNEDGTEWTFTIRDGLQFSDGTPITAQNYLHALQRNSQPIGSGDGAREGGPAWLIYTYVDVANSTAEGNQLKLRLTVPASFFPSIVTFTNFYPLPEDRYTQERFVEPTGPRQGLPVSSGPYMVTEYRAGESLTLEKNPNYNGPHEVKTDKIVIRFFSTSSALKSAVESGGVDVGYRTFTPDEWNDLVQKSGAGANFKTYEEPSPSPLRYLVLNVGKENSPFYTGTGY